VTDAVQDGDIVVRPSASIVKPAFILSTHPGAGQFGCSTRFSAEQLARGYARHAHVDVWFAAEDQAFTSVARFRPATRPITLQSPTRGALPFRATA
jgi:hypothetical protein